MRSFANFQLNTRIYFTILAAALLFCTLPTTTFGQGDPFNGSSSPAFRAPQQPGVSAGSESRVPPIQFNDLRSTFPVNSDRPPVRGDGEQRSILQVGRSAPETNPQVFAGSPRDFPPVGQPAQPVRDFNTTNNSMEFQAQSTADSAPQVSAEAFNFSDRLPHEDGMIRQASATEPVQDSDEPIAMGTQPIGTVPFETSPSGTLTTQQSGGGFQQSSGGGVQQPGRGFQQRPAGGFQQGGRSEFRSPPGGGQRQGGQRQGGRRGPGPAGTQGFGDQPGAGGQVNGGTSQQQPQRQLQTAQQNSGLGAPGQPIRKQPVSREVIDTEQPASGNSTVNPFSNQASQLGSPANQLSNPANSANSGNFGRNPNQNQRFNQAGNSAAQPPVANQNNRVGGSNNNGTRRTQANPVRARNASSSTTVPPNTSAATALLKPYSLDLAPQPLPGTPVSMQQMLQSTSNQNRAQMVGYYWATYRDWCKLHCSANYFKALKKLNGANQIDNALLATAKSAAQNEMLAAEIQLSKSQSQLQRFIPNGQAQPVLPLPSDVPYTTNYTTHYEYFSANRVLSSDIRNIAVSLPKMLELVTKKADTVRASESALNQTQGRGQMTQSLQAAKMWNEANKAFIDSVIDYNRSIAAYSLNVMSPYKPIDQVASALIGTPKSNSTNQNRQGQGDRQATLPGFQQGRTGPGPGPDNGPAPNGSATSPPQYRSANQSFSEYPQTPVGNPGFQTQPSSQGAPASFGRGFGEGFRR